MIVMCSTSVLAKVTVFATLLLAATARRMLQTTCPINVATFCSGKTGLFSNTCDSSCSTYINCANNNGAVQSCHFSLMFNIDSKVSAASSYASMGTGFFYPLHID